MSLKYDSQKKIRKKRSKWKVSTGEEFEEREYALLKESMRNEVQTVVGQVRITAGKAKNIMLDIPRRTRPLTDRMKTQIFDVLSRDIVNTTILDLYAGSGSFGLEAISRGASSAVFVDASKHAERILESNIAKTGFLTNATVVKMKTEEFLAKTAEESTSFDIIFIDPPYKEYNKKKIQRITHMMNLASQLLPGVRDPNIKKRFPGAMIVKHPRVYPIAKLDLPQLKLIETYTYGMNAISIFIVKF